MALSLPIKPMVLTRLRDFAAESIPRKAHSRKLHIWRMTTLPLWIASDVPPPASMRRYVNSTFMDSHLPAAGYLGSTLRRLASYFWMSWWLSSVLRGCSLGVLTTLIWALISSSGAFPTPGIVQIIIIATLGAVPGLIFGWLNRPSLTQVAAMLDRTFELDERLITAIDPRERVHREIETMQQADAANALASIQREIRIVHLLPVREFVLLMVMSTAVMTVWMFAFDARSIDSLSDVRVPGYYPASERMADQQGALPRIPTPVPSDGSDQTADASPGEAGMNTDLQDFGALGKAFDQNDLTRAAASEIAGGDFRGAASALDAAAADIGSASQEERDALADDLDEAADAMSPDNAALAEQTRKTADDIRAGGSQAEKGVTDLADTIEQEAPPPAQETGSESSSSSDGQSAPVGEQQQGGGSQSSQPGSSSSGGSEPGDASSSDQSDPGAGVSAEPGLGEEPAAEDPDSQSSEDAQPGSDSGPSDEQGSSSDNSGSGGDQPASEPGSGQSGSSGSTSSDQGGSSSDSASMGDPQDETSASQGSGAGSGQTNANDTPIDDQAPNTTESGGEPNPSDVPPDVSAGDPPAAPVGETGSNGGGSAGSGDNTLELGGSSDETVQSGNDAGSSSLGSGSSGAGAASGDAQAQQVGPAGPDSNHVPGEYEDIVNDYFSEPVP